MNREIDLDDDTVVEPLPDVVLEAVAGGTSESSCYGCCSCHQCSMGPEPDLVDIDLART